MATPGGQLALTIGDEPVSGYRGPTACKIVGITYRQLDYWARTGLVEPTVQSADGSGSKRLYSFDDIVRLKVVKRLLDAGVSLQKVRLAVEELAHRGQTPADVTLVSDGTSVYAVDDDAQVVDLLRKGQGVFAIAMAPVVAEVEGDVALFPAEPLDDDTIDSAARSA
ncbi:MAG: MerR family transcriptional regulator [Nitriliruptorales bacterium]|nr:MerR family transcriptional regulator [Nitriliruptorales bacterium]